jgi:hypothetical protein
MKGTMRFLQAIFFVLTVLAWGSSSSAIPLTLTVGQLSQSAVAGDTITFSGVITNRTGTILESKDLFVNFSGFDRGIVTPFQVLGATDFTLPNNTFSPSTELFRVMSSPPDPALRQRRRA